MRIVTQPWVRKPNADVSVEDAVYDSLISDNHGIDPGSTARNNSRAIAHIVGVLADSGALKEHDVAYLLGGQFRVE